MIKCKNKYIWYFLFWWLHITILRWRLKLLMSFNVYKYWFINHTSGWLELKQTYHELSTKTMIYTFMLHIKHSKFELCDKHESFLDWCIWKSRLNKDFFALIDNKFIYITNMILDCSRFWIVMSCMIYPLWVQVLFSSGYKQ